MTVSSDGLPEDYIGNGITKAFTYHSRVLLPSDIVVYEDDIAVSSGFTVTLVSNGQGGAIVAYTVAPAVGVVITLSCEPPVTQEIDYKENTAFPAEVQEFGLDKLTLLIQRVLSWFNRNLSRTLRVPLTDPPIVQFPTRTLRAGKWMRFDDDGQPSLWQTPQLIPSTSMLLVENVSALRLVSTPTIAQAGFYYQTRGYNASGDGGGLTFFWSPAEAQADNGFTIIKPNGLVGNGRFVALPSTAGYDIRAAGCRCDGVTDDTARFIAALAVGVPLIVAKGATTVVAPGGVGTAFVRGVPLPSNTRLRVDGYINGRLGSAGERFVRSNSVTLPGTLNVFAYPQGMGLPGTPFLFDAVAAGFVPGRFYAIELAPLAGNRNGTNQAGFDFGYCTVATNTTLELDSVGGTRFAYDSPLISEVVGDRVTGILPATTQFIAGDRTAKFAAGDVVYIVNINGTDSVNYVTAAGTTPYFALNKVLSSTASGITLEATLGYDMTDVYIVKMQKTENIRVSGEGVIDNFNMQFTDKTAFRDFECRSYSHNDWWDMRTEFIRCINDQPRGFGMTFGRKGLVANCVATHSVGISDNGSFKFLSIMDTNVVGCNSWASRSTGGSLVAAFFADFFFTPWKGYVQNVNFVGLSADRQSTGFAQSSRFTGMRRSNVTDLTSMAQVQFEKCVECSFSGIHAAASIVTMDLVDSQVFNFSANILTSDGNQHTTIGPGVLTGTKGANNLRVLEFQANGGFFPINNYVTVLGVRCTSTDAADTFIYLSNCNSTTLIDVEDLPGLANSLARGSNVTLPELISHRLQNPIGILFTNYFPTISGATAAGVGTYTIQQGTWQKQGRFVHVRAIVVTTAHTGTGGIHVALPFAAVGGLNMVQCAAVSLSGTAVTGPQLRGQIDPSTNYVRIRQIDVAGVVTDVAIGAAMTVLFEATYEYAT